MRHNIKEINCVTLANGLMIKGSYSYGQGGLHVNLYLVNPVGNIMAYRNYGFAGQDSGAQEKMLVMLSAMKQLCLASKLDSITQPRIQEAAAKSLMQVLTKEAVFKKAA